MITRLRARARQNAGGAAMKKDAAAGALSFDLPTARLTIHLAAGVTLSQVEKIIDAINVLHLELTGKPISDVSVVAGGA